MNSAEENRLQLVANEISLGFTFIESAQLAYSMGHTEHSDMANQKAQAAYSGAQRFLEGTSADSPTTTLRSELVRLRAALDGLQVKVSEMNLNAKRTKS
jgi:hypothetical protein